MRHFETYLGDGVYAYIEDSGLVWIYTWDGLHETNQIALEPDVVSILILWLREYNERIHNHPKTKERT